MQPQTPTPPVVPQPAPTSAPVAPPPPTPTSTPANQQLPQWPGAFAIFKHSKAGIMLNVWPYVGVLVLTAITSSILNSFRGEDADIAIALPALLISFVTSAIFAVAQNSLQLASAGGEKMSFGQAFSRVGPLFLKMLLLMILMGLAIGFSIAAFLIPFFFVLPRLVMAPYFLIEKNMGPAQALNTSWSYTKGHAMKVWGIIGATLLMTLPVFTVIGIPVTIYLVVLYGAATAILYRYINHLPIVQPTAPQQAPPAPQPVAPVQQQ